MLVTELLIKSAKLITPNTFTDNRGSNIELYDPNNYSELGVSFVFDTMSKSYFKVLRGLHGDFKTWKLIQCIHGTIFFTIVDIRPDSPTYLKHQNLYLSGNAITQVLIPPGCLNGHLCLSEQCIFLYKMSNTYSDYAKDQIKKKWNSNEFNIDWPIKDPILSKDDGAIT